VTSDRAWKKLVAATRRLKRSEGRVARRNARASFATALRQLRAAVDEEFPPLLAKGVKYTPAMKVEDSRIKRVHRQRMTKEQRMEVDERRVRQQAAKAKHEGWVPVPLARRDQVVTDCAAAGVRVRIIGTSRNPRWGRNPGWPWVRQWVLAVAPGNRRGLLEAKHNVYKQRALMAESLLRDGKTADGG
jgi:hypothetical protein